LPKLDKHPRHCATIDFPPSFILSKLSNPVTLYSILLMRSKTYQTIFFR